MNRKGLNRKTCALLSVAVAALLFSCSGPSSVRASATKASDRKLAPDFTLRDANGSPFRLSDYRGKVVLLNFWATWCGPCAVEIPWFIQFEQQYRSKGLEVLGVSMDEDGWSAIKPYVAEHKINYRILLGDDTVSQLYGGLDALPTTFMIDRQGRIAFPPHIGLVGKDEYLHEIQSLLEDGQTNASRRTLRAVPASLLVRPAR